jgi:hyaluronoglucosaminidase
MTQSRPTRPARRRWRLAGCLLLAAALAGLSASPARSAAAAPRAAAQTLAHESAHVTAQTTARTTARAAGAPEPAIWPTPQQVSWGSGSVLVPGAVTAVTGPGTDPAALQALRAVLHRAGVAQISVVQAGRPVPPGQLAIDIGTPDDNTAIGPALTALGAQGPQGLAAGGYVLAAGRPAGGHGGPVVVLAGADATGTFYAVQTLRQLLGRGGPGPARLPDTVIRDWPSMGVRGTIEGFYGPAWSDADISAQLRFYGANKLNTFVYSAKNDPYLRADWPQLYPADQLSALTQLISTAQSQHVQFVYALSPGLSVCYSSAADLQALEAKDQQLWDAGVRQFALFFDDISSGFNCAGDTAQFGSSPDPLAAAQAYLLNAFQTGFIDTHPGAQPLITVPTDYSGTADSAYREVWKSSLSDKVLVYWTGVGVIPQTITAAQAAQVAGEFGHQIVVWDNYPVNDYQPTRLFLGPLTGRAADLGSQVAGLTSNPMQEAAPSTVPLFTTADYTWNPAAYDNDQQAAWNAGIDSYGGPAAAALRVLADSNQSTPRIGTAESPALTPLISAFWTAYAADQGPAISPQLRTAARALITAWQQIAAAPPVIDRLLPHADFTTEAGPWLAKFRAWGLAGAAAVRYLLDTTAGAAGPAAAQQAALEAAYRQAAAIPDVVGEGVFQAFALKADPALVSDSVLLYAADAADDSAALAAASGAGLSPDQVTQSFATAWSAASSGEYLVIAVGGPADNALYYNTCSWDNPSGLPGGSTPFYLAAPPLAAVPAMNAYENGAGQTAAQTAALSADLAWYAAHGSLPAGVTALPAAAGPARSCAGQPAP